MKIMPEYYGIIRVGPELADSGLDLVHLPHLSGLDSGDIRDELRFRKSYEHARELVGEPIHCKRGVESREFEVIRRSLQIGDISLDEVCVALSS